MERQGSERRLVFRILGHWQQVRGIRLLPRLGDFSAADLAEDWEHCAILRREAVTNRFFVADIGIYLDPRDYPMTGKFVDECPSGSLLQEALAQMPRVFDKRVPISVGGQFGMGDTVMLYRCILLPASETEAAIDGLLVGANFRVVARGRSVADLTI